MSPDFPIREPERLPLRIEPCPIVEAVFEVRFTSLQPWENMPGLLYSAIRDRYPTQKRLPLADFPDDFRRQNPAFQHQPLLQFHGEHFLMQLGPRSLGLVTQPNVYPGWGAIQQELRWLRAGVEKAGFFGETERLSVRYIDFFKANVFEILQLEMRLGGQAVASLQTDATTILRSGPMTIRLHATNAALTEGAEGAQTGSILDVDVWFGALESDFFGNGLERFSEAHDVIKRIFFGLMKPEFLASLSPQYP